MRLDGKFPGLLLKMLEQRPGLQNGCQFQENPYKTVGRSLSSGSLLVAVSETLCSKLEEVTSELSNLKEAMRSQSAPRNAFTSDKSRQPSHSSASPGGPMSSKSSHSDAAHAAFHGKTQATFYGIEYAENSAYGIGEQYLGDIKLDGTLIVQLFQQY